MILNKIQLTNYRNYKNLDLNFNPKTNIIYGNNGQGKTNILEAIYLCATGRSHRTSKEHELVRFGQPDFCVTIHCQKKDGSCEIEYRHYEGKREIRVNGVHIQKLGRLMGNLSAVLFAPEDIFMLKEGPQERRRFLDIAISQQKNSYFFDLQEYKKLLANRNALLKEIRQKPKLKDTLFIWNQSLAETGARIVQGRCEFLERLQKVIGPKHAQLTDKQEEISVRYKSVLALKPEWGVKDLEQKLLQKLLEREAEDMHRCSTSVGPHRDDFEMDVNGIPLKHFGSQGQQRTAILSLKLAEIQSIKDLTGEYPVLLLDDFASELDEKRQNLFLKSLDALQVIVTSTHKEILTRREDFDVKYIYVVGGTLKDEEK